MCEKIALDKKKPTNTAFDKWFTFLKPILKQSDYVVGNLETVFAGEEQKFTHEMYSFNTPDEFLLSLKELPVNFVTTANNHALDRGIDGLERTVKVLDKNDIEHVGTSLSSDIRRISIVELHGIKVAFIACTSSINYRVHGTILEKEAEKQICLMCPQDFKTYPTAEVGKLKLLANKMYSKVLGQEGVMRLKKLIGRKHNTPYKDALSEDAIGMLIPFASQIGEDIKKAKELADIVIVAPHMGGQFNPTPGSFVEWYMKYFANLKVDVIVSNHPHIIQKTEIIDRTYSFYSLGNFSLSPKSTYVIMENRPDIGLLLHMYINTSLRSIERFTITPIQMIHDDEFMIKPLLSSINKNARSEYVEFLEERLQVKLTEYSENELSISYS